MSPTRCYGAVLGSRPPPPLLREALLRFVRARGRRTARSSIQWPKRPEASPSRTGFNTLDARVHESTPMIARWVWVTMTIGIGIEFALGVACFVLLPVRRPAQWLPSHGGVVYVVHAAFGGLLAIAALLIFMAVRDGTRLARLGGLIGLVGLMLGAVGGMLSVSHSWRLTGIGLMFVGALLAFFGYLIPLADVTVRESSE
jgi:hypothetical protein